MHPLIGTLLTACLLTACVAAPSASKTSAATQQHEQTTAAPPIWPNGARAAVSLTYDDALVSQLDTAVPALNARGLRATFFLTTSSPALTQNEDRWKALLASGHEFANHTVTHPCSRSFPWVPKGSALEDFDEARMTQELIDSSASLIKLGAKEVRSFAYPCDTPFIGEDHRSYIPLVKNQFAFARSAAPMIADPRNVDLHQVPAFDGSQSGLVQLLDQAVQKHGWLVFVFHGVGREHIAVSEQSHSELLDQLAKRRAELWTAPFSEVAEHILVARNDRRETAPGTP